MTRITPGALLHFAISLCILLHVAEAGSTRPDPRMQYYGSLLAATPGIIPLRACHDLSTDDTQPFAVTDVIDGVRVFFSPRGVHLVRYAFNHCGDALHSEGRGYEPDGEMEMHRVDMLVDGADLTEVEFFDMLEEYRWVYTPAFASTNGRVYRGLRYRNVYPGIDLEFMLQRDGVKYQFVLQPGADPGSIGILFDGASAAVLRDDGSVSHDCGDWRITDGAPVAFTRGAGARDIDVRWSKDGRMLRFAVGAVKAGETLILDPFLQWSTFIGGELSDYARDIAVDADGAMLICGYTASPVFPVSPGAMQSAVKGNFDIFVAKFTRERQRAWSTLYGGSGSEENPRIAIAPQGDIIVAASTSSTDLPVSDAAFQKRNGGRYDVFLLALDASGRQRWCTYFGGSYTDEVGGLAIDSRGGIHIAGGTYSTNLPVTSDAIQTSNAGDYDMFVARFSPAGLLEWASYLGGWSMDFATDIAVTSAGDMVVAGRTESANLPAMNTGTQQRYGGGSFDGVIYRIDGKTRRIVWGSYLGGEAEDSAERVAIDANGRIAVTGYTASSRFPVKGASARSKHAGLIDAFVTIFDPGGDIIWSTLLGGSEVDKATGLDVDGDGNVYLTGFTASDDFPLAGAPFQKEKGRNYDAFIVQYGQGGSYLWGSFMGGEGHDISHGLAVDNKGNVVVVGGTESRNFRTIGTPFQRELGGLTDAFILRIIFNEPLANAGADTTICLGSSVRLGGDISGGQPPYIFAWSPTDGLDRSNEQRPLATPGRSTSYVMTITDAEGATARDTVEVTVAPLPVANAGKDVSICHGTSTTLSGSASGGAQPYTYSWLPDDGLSNPAIANPVASPRRSTRYLLTVTDARGCAHSDSMSVTVHPALSVTAGDDRIACATIPLTLNAVAEGGKAPYRYAWKPVAGMNNAETASPVFIPANSGSVIVTVTDANGCAAHDTIRLTVHQPPVVDAGDAVILCLGDKTTLRPRVSGGKAPYSYRWTPGDNLSSAMVVNPQVTASTTTTYTLAVSDANGCTVYDSIVVAVYTPPSLNVEGDVTVCAGAPVRIGAEAVGGTAPYRYSWSPAAGLDNATAATPAANPRRNTTYTVTVTDANGCKTQAIVRVTVRPRPVITLRDRSTVCQGAVANLSATVRGGTPPYSYSWSPVEGLSAANIANPVATPSVSTQYTLTVTDAAGCQVQATADVVLLDPPIVDAGEALTLCSGAAGTLNASLTGGRTPYRYSWNPSTGLSSARILNPNVSVARTTVYTLTATDANGCVGSDTVVVYVTEAPKANAGAEATICAGGSTQLGGNATGGTPPYTYQWSPSFGLSDATSPTPTAAPTSSTQYTLTVTDVRGCISSDRVTVHVHPAPAITVPKEMTICRGQGKQIELSVTGGTRPYRFEWLPREGLSDATIASPVANPIQTTTYSVTVIDAKGCRSSASVVVTVLPCNKADAGEDADLCFGEQVRLGSIEADLSDDAVFSWTPESGLDNATSPSPVASPARTTSYILRVRNSYGCVAADTVRLRVRPSPSVKISDDRTICAGRGTQLAVRISGGKAPYRIVWSPEDGLARPTAARTEARPSNTTLYTVHVTDASGCSASDSVLVTVSQPPRMEMDRDVLACIGSEVQLGGSVAGGTPPFSFFWSPPEGLDQRNSATPVLTARRSITYRVTITDANNCQSVDTVRITVRQLPSVQLNHSGTLDLCEGQELQLRPTPGFAQYRWSDGYETANRVLRESGVYNVAVRDEDGCEGLSETLELRVHPRPAPEITALGPLRFCQGDSVVLDAGAGFLAYQWSTGAESRTITVYTSGSYSVTVRGAGDCEAAARTVTVTVDEAPEASFIQRGDTLIAAAADSYQWLRDGAVIEGANERMFVVHEDGAYQVQLRNVLGCTATSEARVIRSGAMNAVPFMSGPLYANERKMKPENDYGQRRCAVSR
jgi:hypothetical protein